MENNLENNLIIGNRDNQIEMELPPGFRFHPTDEELITHYLSKKVLRTNFSCQAIIEVDMNKVEPWDLPWRSKLGEYQWYFFSIKDKKYQTGLRTNRATGHGYWKATGKDKEILKGKLLVGMKKTLVFYEGRAPSGVKSNWVTHEYRLEGKFSYGFRIPNKNDWVISKVFLKTSGGQNVHISEIRRMDWEKFELPPSPFQPIMDHSPFRAIESEVNQVNYFSNSFDLPQHSEQNMVTHLSNSICQPSHSFDTFTNQLQYQGETGYQMSSSILIQDPPILRNLIDNYGHNNDPTLRNQRELVNLSKETAVITEKSSIVSNLEMEKRSFEEEIRLEDLDLIWDIDNPFYLKD